MPLGRVDVSQARARSPRHQQVPHERKGRLPHVRPHVHLQASPRREAPLQGLSDQAGSGHVQSLKRGPEPGKRKDQYLNSGKLGKEYGKPMKKEKMEKETER